MTWEKSIIYYCWSAVTNKKIYTFCVIIQKPKKKKKIQKGR